MNTQTFESQEEWIEARRGRITGSKLGKVIGTSPYTKEDIMMLLSSKNVDFDKKSKKEELDNMLGIGDRVTLQMRGDKNIGFYELIAEKIAFSPDGENPMDRGHRLEEEAITKFEEETGKVVDKSLVLWTREDNENIAVSPDGFIGESEAIEVKCLKSANHIEALLTQQLPGEYELQALQYFIVNPKLQTLYFVFYDPRLSVKQFFYFTIKREDKEHDIEQYLQYQKRVLEEVDKLVLDLTF